ncbi:endonuclease/exonuclease/phosphatase family protein [bacterium]|nr:endonuclease/exonuclease/phosphatase family protein [bacterium]MBU1921514.1 endonuclease/exonuclease/phosphatase family protein [bacterium]
MNRSSFKLLLLAGALSLISCCCFAQEPLKVVTYNLQGMRPGSNWQVRMVFIVQYLEELDPDVICLQEINETTTGGGEDNMARTIADELSEHFGTTYHYYFAQTHIAWDQFYEGIGIVSKYPVTNEGFRSLPQSTFPRKVAWNRIDSPLGFLNIFSTHLAYQSGDNAIRVQQVETIMEYISETEAANPSAAAILGGDFNTTPGSDPINLLVNDTPESEYTDTFAEANPGQNGYTVPAEAPTSRIDFLFYRNTGSLLIDTSYVVMNATYDGSHYPSDHLGVMTVFSSDPNGIEAQRHGRNLLDYRLEQNYPNPFNGQTTIRYSVPTASHVSLEIIDLLGRRVKQITDETSSSGVRSIVWDARGQSSGIYFYTLATDQFRATKSCLLLK